MSSNKSLFENSRVIGQCSNAKLIKPPVKQINSVHLCYWTCAQALIQFLQYMLKDSYTRRHYGQGASTCHMAKADCICAWDSSPYLPTTPDEAWYWPKRVLCSGGWLYITSRPTWNSHCSEKWSLLCKLCSVLTVHDVLPSHTVHKLNNDSGTWQINLCAMFAHTVKRLQPLFMSIKLIILQCVRLYTVCS